MKDLGLTLRTAYYERLNGAITLNGSDVPIYDSVSVPADTVEPYILLTDFVSTEIGEGSKQTYGQNCFFSLEVVTKFPNAVGGKDDADSLVNQILTLVRTRQAGYFDLSPDFNLVSVVLDATQTIQELASDGMIVRRLIRFGHLIYEN